MLFGYNVELRFPAQGMIGSPRQYATLPGYTAAPTTPALTVDLSSTGQERDGVIHIESDPDRTERGGLPSPGLYTGEIILTLTAN